MLFQPGHARVGGRKAGRSNRITRDIREMIAESLERAGGIDYLVKQALKKPAAYLALVGKIIPQQIDATIRRELPDMTREDLLVMLDNMRAESAAHLVETRVIEHNEG